jgi:SOS-response transcriptional repressor LexA
VSVGDILPADEGCFVAKAAGNSMAQAGIEDGDVLIVREHDSVPDATVCVAHVEGELFVKRLFYRDDVEFRDDDHNGVFRVRPKQQWSVLGRVTHAVKPMVFTD